jgi:hypothetical protein
MIKVGPYSLLLLSVGVLLSLFLSRCASLNLHSFTTLLQRPESAIVVLPLHTFCAWSSGSHRWNRYLLLAQAYLLCNDSRVVLKSPACQRGWDLQIHIHSFGSSTLITTFFNCTLPCKSNSTITTTTKHPFSASLLAASSRSTIPPQKHHNAFPLQPQHCFRLSSPSQDCLLDFSHSHPQCSSVTCLREL